MNWQVGLYLAAVIAPLIAFAVEAVGVWVRPLGRHNPRIATGAAVVSFALSLAGFVDYFGIEARGVFFRHAVKQEGPESIRAETLADSKAVVDTSATLAWVGSFDWVTVGHGFAGPSGTSLPPLTIPFGVRIDNLTVLMFLLVTFVGSLVHLYSISYLHDEPRLALYFAYLSLFVASMLALLISSNLFFVFVFWELVGVCSYLLIGFWRGDPANTNAANKAFLVNRIGDAGMIVGFGLLWTSLGTLDIDTINRSIRDGRGDLHVEASASDMGGEGIIVLRDRETGAALKDGAERPSTIAHWVLTIAGLGIFAACAGKSAQFPLQVWLPDAMAGPTPVSALIHAATMVAAGVYLAGRFYPVFTGEVLLIIAYAGAITVFIGATIAVVQTDYKKVLAYSTVSQLGFMMLGLGVGGWGAGLFHLLTHGCFKALLFLGAGSLHHAVGTYDMKALGGLAKKLPVTSRTMLIGTLAISGVPFFSGFYSKDAILASCFFRVSQPGASIHFALVILPIVGTALTAFYMFRMWFLCFAGESRSHEIAGRAVEPDRLITWPLIALAVPSVLLGWTFQLGLPLGEPILEQMLSYGQPLPANDLGASHFYAVFASLIVAAAGIGAGVAYYAPPLPFLFRRRFEPTHAARRLSWMHRFLCHKWYFDEIYQAIVVKPTLTLAKGFANCDRLVIDPVVNGVARSTAAVAKLQGLIDREIVDGFVKRFGTAVFQVGDWSRRLQTGRLRDYLLFMALATVGIGFGLFAWVR